MLLWNRVGVRHRTPILVEKAGWKGETRIMRPATLYHFQRKAYQQFEHEQKERLLELLTKSYTHIEEISDERLRLVSLAAVLAMGCGYNVGLYKLPEDLIQEVGWSHLVLIDLPAGQLSFPCDDTHLPYFHALPLYQGLFMGLPERRAQLIRLLDPGCTFLNFGKTEPMPAVLYSSDPGPDEA